MERRQRMMSCDIMLHDDRMPIATILPGDATTPAMNR